MRGELVLGLALAASSTARADVPLAALAPSPADARAAVAIGPSGEVYEPDGHGNWSRRRNVSIASAPVTAAARAADRVVAITHDGPPFRLTADGWTAIHVGTHTKPLTGSGPRLVAAVGRSLYALDTAEPTKLADAPAPILALAASSTGVVVETERGLARLEGHAWKPIAGAPHHVVALASDRIAIVADAGRGGLYDLRANKPFDWPAGTHAIATSALEDGLVAVAQRGKALELVTLRAGKLASEPIPLDTPASAAPANLAVVGVTADRAGRAIVALRDGRLLVRTPPAKASGAASWTTLTVRDELPAARPGPAPAESP